MGALTIQRLACIFAIFYLMFEPNIQVFGADEELEENLPSEYKGAIGPGSVILNNIWDSYTMRYARTSSDAITIVLWGPYKQGWVGIGFSKTGGMLGSSAMIARMDEGGKLVIKQYSLEGFTPSEVVADEGALELTKVSPACFVSKGYIHMAFQLKLLPYNNMTTQKVIFASSSDPTYGDVLKPHTQNSVKEIDFSHGTDHRILAEKKSGSADNFATRKVVHGSLGLFAWQVLIPAGIIISSCLKHLDPQWFYLHVSCQITAYVISCITIFMGLKLFSDMNKHNTLPYAVNFHKFTGIVVAVLSTIQITAIFARPAKDHPKRNIWNKYHLGLGYVVAGLGFAQILIGYNAARGSRAWFYVCVVLLLIDTITTYTLTKRMQSREAETHDHRPPIFNP